MRKITAAAIAAIVMGSAPALAQFSPPTTPAVVDPATLFSRQCGTCHVAVANGGPRQGPNLAGVMGRTAGSVAGFKYSPGYASSGIVWTAETLDAYLANPQTTIPGSVMAYRQADPQVRATIIGWLGDQH